MCRARNNIFFQLSDNLTKTCLPRAVVGVVPEQVLGVGTGHGSLSIYYNVESNNSIFLLLYR